MTSKATDTRKLNSAIINQCGLNPKHFSYILKHNPTNKSRLINTSIRQNSTGPERCCDSVCTYTDTAVILPRNTNETVTLCYSRSLWLNSMSQNRQKQERYWHQRKIGKNRFLSLKSFNFCYMSCSWWIHFEREQHKPSQLRCCEHFLMSLEACVKTWQCKARGLRYAKPFHLTVSIFKNSRAKRFTLWETLKRNAMSKKHDGTRSIMQQISVSQFITRGNILKDGMNGVSGGFFWS